jgi:hypothetical protein
MTQMRSLSSDYEALYRVFLSGVATTARPGREWTVFWPMIGHRYQNDLLIVGRAVNGWPVRWNANEQVSVEEIAALVAAARHQSEGDGTDPMDWVTWFDGHRTEYSTRSSAFWRVARRVRNGLLGESDDWPRSLAWTNLVKVAPWGHGNPGGKTLDIQRELGPELFVREIAELKPRRILVMAGRWWFEPFATALGLAVDWRDGIVEGVADGPEQRWVILPHPMTRPEGPLVENALAAFA